MSGFIIHIPTRENELREEIEDGLSPYARVSESPKKFGVEEFRLLVELLGVAANAATVAAFLYFIRDRYRQQNKPSRVKITKGDVTIELDTADETTLKEFLENT